MLLKLCGITYRNVENQMKEFLQDMKNIILYFKFVKNDKMLVEVYDAQKLIISKITFEFGIGSTTPVPRIELWDDAATIPTYETLDEVLDYFGLQFIYYLVTCLWYMATTSQNKQYVYEEKTPMVIGRRKNVVQVSDTKYIRTPIYDLKKVKTVKVDKLISRKKGWTYSHSFQVHGHYRHYKDGKTIFIESYIKGKEKPFKPQTTVLTPKKIKEES